MHILKLKENNLCCHVAFYFSMGLGAFVIGLSQISSFFSRKIIIHLPRPLIRAIGFWCNCLSNVRYTIWD